MNRRAPERSSHKLRNPIDYAIEELEWRRDMLKEMAPATDNPEHMMWKVRALERAVELLKRPRFDMNPFV